MELKLDDLALFMGETNNTYVEKLYAKRYSFFKGINWIAMLYPPIWLAYRKMALETFLFILAYWGLAVAAYLLVPIGSVDLAIWTARILCSVFIGVFANTLYVKKMTRIINRTGFMSDQSRKEYLGAIGGVNRHCIWIFYIADHILVVPIGLLLMVL